MPVKRVSRAKRVVSVIVATRNRPAMLREALASIRALEGPDLTFEILVGDNGSAPETADIVAEFGGVHERTETDGCPAARNLALRRMTGDFVAFLDDDDVWTRDNIRPHIALMDADPEIGVVFGQIVHADHELRRFGRPWPVGAEMQGDIFVRMLSGYFPQVGATVVRGDVARQIGLMDERLIGDSDWDWQLRLTRSYKTGFTPTPSVICRGRPSGSYDVLQKKRARYTRRIFWRHVLRNLSRWPTPVHLLRSYFRAMDVYYYYFVQAAFERAHGGDYAGARRAIRSALALNPARALRSIARRSRLGSATRRAVFPFVGHGRPARRVTRVRRLAPGAKPRSSEA
ncbi:MAG TPA: glycosyltransferase family 2 protein [Phenylobacterium sp.]|uniref:glycosyltransferase family 2 protein n=1 Tax=Phenylobacterium sp. TaxID=1871053 RepID=UPI002B472B8E|nr:glycosyltransferase family 2 protein [Phenylobacterium sp.]HKR87649.1 glycosyltransferase family 2 protein [Phenylobacterium sp.]